MIIIIILIILITISIIIIIVVIIMFIPIINAVKSLHMITHPALVNAPSCGSSTWLTWSFCERLVRPPRIAYRSGPLMVHCL
jgi:hypothetical protein